MARIAGVDLPREKRVEIALTYIYGIGRKTANDILAATGVNPDTRVKDMTEEDEAKIREYIDHHLIVEGDKRRDVALNILKSTGVNASEEGATEIANILADTIINGDYSGYAEAYRSYLAAGKSEKEADRLAKQDMAKQVGMAAFGGAVQGGFMGGIGSAWGYFGNRDANSAAGSYFTDENGRINAENRNALIAEGLASENEEIRAYAETLEDKRTMSREEAGQLYRMLAAESQGNYNEVKAQIGRAHV